MASLLSNPLLYIGVTAVVGYYAYQQFAIWNGRRRMIQQLGCKPPPTYDDNSHSWLPWLYNMKQARFLMKHGAKNEILTASHERYLEYGLTHHSKVSLYTDSAATFRLIFTAFSQRHDLHR